MNDKDLLINDILDYFVMNKHDHCVAEDHDMVCEDLYEDNEIKPNMCIDCWLYYFKKGEWWEYEPEDVLDRADREYHKRYDR